MKCGICPIVVLYIALNVLSWRLQTALGQEWHTFYHSVRALKSRVLLANWSAVAIQIVCSSTGWLTDCWIGLLRTWHKTANQLDTVCVTWASMDIGYIAVDIYSHTTNKRFIRANEKCIVWDQRTRRPLTRGEVHQVRHTGPTQTWTHSMQNSCKWYNYTVSQKSSTLHLSP